MAMIDVLKMDRYEKNTNRVHDVVSSTYSVFDVNGKTYFQIDTYGRSTRTMPEKISQTIQIDRESAIVLKQILEDTFHI